MVDRIPSTEQSFYKISLDLDGISGSVDGLEEAIATLGEGIEALDASVDAVTAAIDAQGAVLQEILEETRGPAPIEIETGGIILPSDAPFQPVALPDITDPDGWINVYEYETVSMIASVQASTYQASADTPPLTFDHTVSTFEQFKEAVVNAADGATIYVEPGTYMIDEQIVLDKPVSIYGAGDTTIFQAGENTSSVLDFEILFAIKSSNVKLQSFKLLVNSLATTSYHRCFFMVEDYTTQTLDAVGSSPVVSVTRAMWQGTVENIEFVNITLEANKRVAIFIAGLTNNVRVQNCTFNAVADNVTANAGSPIVGSFHGIGGDWLFQDCDFNLTPLFPANAYRWHRIFTMNTANYWAVLNGVPGYDIRQSTCRFTVRNVEVQHKTPALIDIAPDANDTYLLDPLEGMEICLDNVTCYVESNNPLVVSGAADRFYGAVVVVRGTYYNPAGANGPNTRVPYLLDSVKDISIANCNITGGERGLIYVRNLFEAAFPNYTPVESVPVLLTSGVAISIHLDNNTLNWVNPLKLVEGAAGPSPYNNLIDVFGDRTFLHLEANLGSSYAGVDFLPSEGVQPPADIFLPGRGTFEVRTEYRLVQDGLELEFVPATSIDILTEPQKEIINPRIPAVLVGVLEIRFLVRAIATFGDSFLTLYGTIR